jgi:hypothetical protein
VTPGGPGQVPSATTTAETKSSPVSVNPSLVPAASTPAPDVGEARLPKDPPPLAPPNTIP